MKRKSFLLAAVSAFVLVSVAKADGAGTDKFVLSGGSSAVMFGLNEWFLANSQPIAPQPDGSYRLTFPMRFADSFLNFGTQIAASGDDSSITVRLSRSSCLPKGTGSRLWRSRLPIRGRNQVMSRFTLISSPTRFFWFANGAVTFIPGVYEQFQPSSGQDAILTITSDDPPASTPEPSAGLSLAAGLFLSFSLRKRVSKTSS